MNPISILSHAIRQDSQGRYCINDLHRAAGGERRHQPNHWLTTKQAQELIAELIGTPGIPGVGKGTAGIPAVVDIATTGIPLVLAPVFVINGGTQRGTYVVKELVYSYAMWISAAFHVKVVRAYDALVQSQNLKVQPNADHLAVVAAKDQTISAWIENAAAQKRSADCMQMMMELTKPKPKGPPKERIDNNHVRLACAKRGQGKTVSQIAREMGLSVSTISLITRSVVV
jgi:hypothetical protein